MRNYRMRNETRAFINTYYEDVEFNEGAFITVESFIKAKEAEFCAIHGVDKVEFDQRLLNKFHERVILKGDELDGDYYFHVAGMLATWRELRDEQLEDVGPNLQRGDQGDWSCTFHKQSSGIGVKKLMVSDAFISLIVFFFGILGLNV